ncbi:class I SAM-dependent methyltransferase [Tomitella gaofuii]|uniref:class I SAM-dependent methyltransferase n=1 Tax=Tomitella gaofuii TaxID=2760083 RepID=UPI0015FC4CBF|nr:class I SAM-dependent methyltransferase [Tomitella gaofuii]
MTSSPAPSPGPSPADPRAERWHRYWDKHSGHYDESMQQMDRWVFGDSRQWACGQASGEVLEVAVGTGLNLPLYPEDAALTGIDLSEQMLAQARDRAASLGREVTLRQADAHALPFDDGALDTAVCTFGLCAIPDIDRAVAEMHRVLRPGGRLILVDHVASTSRIARGVQRGLETFSIPLGGEHFRRRPHDNVLAAGFEVEKSDRFKLGVVERLVARKPQ